MQGVRRKIAQELVCGLPGIQWKNAAIDEKSVGYKYPRKRGQPCRYLFHSN